MSRRAGDWSLVGRDSDPVPADGAAVDRVAAEFESRGRDMTTAADVLSRLAKRTEWVGEAGESFADEAGSTHEDLADAARKYVDAGKALRTFSEAVFDARSETWAGLLAAELADGDRARNADPAPGSAVPTATPDPAAEAEESRRRARLLQAQDELAAARRRVDKAMHALDEAAQRARKAIDAASGHYKDGFWDDVKGFVSTAIKAILDVLNVIAIILAVVIIVLVVIGTGGAALAFLIPAAFWLGVAIFGLTAVQVAMGDAGWGDLAWASLGLIGGGLGKGGAALGKYSLQSLRLAGEARVAASARNAIPAVLRRGLQSTYPRSRALAETILQRRIAREVAAFKSTVDGAATIASRPVRTLAQIADADEALSTIRQIRALRPHVDAGLLSTRLGHASVGLMGAGSATALAGQIHDFGGVVDLVKDLPGDLQDAWDEQGQLLESATSLVGIGR
ncbi:hypothetical protein K8Z61_17935 [Nocardioides sp. TRM66260-LWL]|uniref:hypothetical protein n=1 Tax=Nocardioides sp. TRM66260-LWL TaxID=2874478 RepID=UPI001CC3F416|nr:hypothetical protein [Nocardioides sp. TRM66260-LWL]MBZ5736375.1 hypothetical protein [Nocardioides sp. TRM66260-LWL]